MRVMGVKGSDDSFEAFAGTHLKDLLRTATAICGDPHLAEDLVQDVLIKALRRWHSISRTDLPIAYLRRMLVNEFISQGRRKRATPVADPPVRDAYPDQTGRVDDHLSLQREISSLPRQQQVVLALRYFADLSDDQIAQALGCRPSTVRSYVSRALATLRVSNPTLSHK